MFHVFTEDPQVDRAWCDLGSNALPWVRGLSYWGEIDVSLPVAPDESDYQTEYEEELLDTTKDPYADFQSTQAECGSELVSSGAAHRCSRPHWLGTGPLHFYLACRKMTPHCSIDILPGCPQNHPRTSHPTSSLKTCRSLCSEVSPNPSSPQLTPHPAEALHAPGVPFLGVLSFASAGLAFLCIGTCLPSAVLGGSASPAGPPKLW